MSALTPAQLEMIRANSKDEAAFTALVELFEQNQAIDHMMREFEETVNDLRRNEAIFKMAEEMARLGGWELDVETQQVIWTEQVYRIHEVDPDFVPDLETAIAFYAPQHRSIIRRAIEHAITTGTPWDIELQFVTAKGKLLWVRVIGQAEFEQGRVARLRGTFQDITALKQAEQAIRRSERMYRTLIETSPDAITVSDLRGKLLLVNERAAELFGFRSISHMVNQVRNIADLIVIEDRSKAQELIYARPDARIPIRNSLFKLRRETGGSFHAEISSSLVVNAVGKPVQSINIIRDVTRRLNKDRDLRYHLSIEKLIADVSTRFVRLPGDKVNEGVDYALHQTGLFTHADRCYLNLFEPQTTTICEVHEWMRDGLESLREDLLGLTISDAWMLEKLQNFETVSVTNVDKLPEEAATAKQSWKNMGIQSLLQFSLVWDNQLVGLFGFTSDVADRPWNSEEFRLLQVLADVVIHAIKHQRSELALQQSESKFRNVVEQAHDGIHIINQNGAIVEWNHSMELVTGILRDNALGRYLWDVKYELLPPDAQQNVTPADLEAQTRTLMQSQPESPDPEDSIIEEFTIQRPDGDQRIVQSTAFHIALDGQILLCEISRDVTEKKEAEKQILRLALERERVSMLGNFIQDVSHEFRTPLSVIQTKIHLLQHISDPDRQMTHYGGIYKQTDNIIRLVDSLTTMTRLDSIETLTTEALDLNGLVLMVETHFASDKTSKREDLTVKLLDKSVSVAGHSAELFTAINNVVENAFHHNPGGVQVTISLFVDGNCGVIVIEDNGEGMPPEVVSRIFERLYRADSAHTTRGFGLGLSITQRVIELHGGRIQVDSTPGKGTRFEIYLPLWSQA